MWVAGSYRMLTYKGEEAMLAAHHDITERKRNDAERERALREAQERADRDPLTNLLNHRAFQSRLAEEAARARREKTTLAVVMLDLDNFKFFNDVYGHGAGDEVLRLVAQRLEQTCRPYDIVARFGGDEFAILLPGVGHTLINEVESRLTDEPERAGLFSRRRRHCHSHNDLCGSRLVPHQGAGLAGGFASGRRAPAALQDRSRRGDGNDRLRVTLGRALEGFSLLDALVAAVDNKDRYTRKHSEDVAAYCLRIARELGLSQTEERTLAVAALLHDVGKIGVPDAILRKPGPLTEQEFAAIRQHPQMGAILVQAVPGLEDTLDAVRHHHERWDGQGYPSGLRAEETPLLARVMAVADAFSAMTTDRPYRKGMPHEEAASILSEGMGKQWDESCVTAFLRAQNSRSEGTMRQ